MGYTHYCYVSKKFDEMAFAKVATDLKKMLTPLRHLGVILADGLGENYPLITPTEITFNELEKCGHTKRDLGITWPAKSASGISKNNTSQQLQEIVNGSWFAGATLSTRVCGGDCSHEAFSLSQRLETTITRHDGCTYEMEPDKDEIGKYFQSTKTAYKPYDLAVTVCLVITKHHLGEQITIHSDGNMEHWHEAIQLCHHFLGYGRGFCLDDEDSAPLDVADAHAMIIQYSKNKKEITSIQESQEKLENTQREQIAKINYRYNKTIDELHIQRRIETQKLEEKIESASKECIQKTEKLSAAESTLNRTIYFLRQQKEELNCKLDEISNYDKRHLEIIEKYQDDCMSLHLYIAENDRPKNKYSIIVAGASKFGEDILECPYSYGVDLNAFGLGLSILSEIRHFPRIDDAKNYHKKHNMQKILKEFFAKYTYVKAEYEKTCKKYSLDDFAGLLYQRFVTYWERTSERSREITTKEFEIKTTDIKKMTEKQISHLMYEKRHCY